MAGTLQRVDGSIELGIVADSERDEEAVGGIDRRVADRLVTDRDDALALLAGALGDELFRPQRIRLDLLRREDGHLVASLVVERAHHRSETEAAVEVAGNAGHAVPAHAGRSLQEQAAVDPDDRSGNEAEHAQRGVAATDIRRILEEVQEVSVARDGRERRSRVGHRDEMRARVVADGCSDFPEMGQVGERLQRRARFARHDVPGCLRIDGAGHPGDGERIGRVQHVQRRLSLGAAEGAAQHLWAEARAAHAQEHAVAPPGLAHLGGEGLEGGEPLTHGADDVEPAQPVVDDRCVGAVTRLPEVWVAVPDPRRDAARGRCVERHGDRAGVDVAAARVSGAHRVDLLGDAADQLVI